MDPRAGGSSLPVVLGARRDATRGVLLVSCFGAFLAFLDSTVVNVAFADVQRDFEGSTYADLSWVFNAYNVVFAALLVMAGRFADLLGRRRTFATGVVVFTLASAWIAAAPTLGWLVAGRAVQAVGAALLVPASLALVMSAYPVSRRSHAIGLWSAAAALAAGLGPAVGGALVDLGGWRLAFLINLPLGAAALLASRTALVESRSPGRRALPDVPGTLLLVLGVGALSTALVQGDAWGWTSGAVLSTAAVAVVAVAVVARRCTTHPVPVVEPALLRRRGFTPALLLTALAGTGFYAYLLVNVLWMTSVWDYSLLQAGAAGAPGALIAGAVSAKLGKVADRHGARVLVVPGALLWASSFGWYLAVAGPDPDYLRVWMPGQVLSGLGIGLTLPVLGAAAAAAVPGARYATASAVVTAVRQLGAVLGISLLVVVLGQPRPDQVVDALRRGWLFAALCFVGVSVGALRLRQDLDVTEEVDDGEEPAVVLPVSRDPGGPAARIPVHRPTSVVELLRSVPVFASLQDDAVQRLVAGSTTVHLDAGQVLFEQGASADAVYVVRSGRVDVVRDGEVVAETTCGGVVGELGLLTGAPRAAAVRARRDSRLLRVSAAAFQEALDGDAAASQALAVALARRLQVGDAAPRRRAALPRLVAVLAADPHAASGDLVVAVAGGLRAALADVDAVFPDPADRDALEGLEAVHDLVVLVAPADGPWRDTCLRQADRVVLVAASTGEPPAGMPAGAELLLIGDHPGREAIDRWEHVARPVRTVLCGDDLALRCRHLADRLTGRSVGLCLSGGGARALAHLGVLAELEDAGVVVGRVSGCSMGAYVAALVAMGLCAREVDARVYEEYVRRNPLGDWTLSRTALTRGRRGYAMLDRSFGDLDLEELPLPLVTSAVDVRTRELVMLDRGPVRDAVAASIALPGVSPAHQMGDRLFVDGGVVDNSPVTPLRRTGEGPVLLSTVLDVSAGGAAAVDRPGLVETVLRAMTTGSAAATHAARRDADLVISPAARGVGLLEFHQVDRMVEAGRSAARAALDLSPPGLLPVRVDDHVGRAPVADARTVVVSTG